MPLEELDAYRPNLNEPKDFDAFWQRTLAENPFAPATVRVTTTDTPLVTVTVSDVVFGGFNDDPVRAWLLMPVTGHYPADDAAALSPSALPIVVEFLGMGGGRGLPWERLAWASAGYAHLIMDTRGQGAHWGSGGDTPDPHGNGPAAAGVTTRGIESPELLPPPLR